MQNFNQKFTIWYVIEKEGPVITVIALAAFLRVHVNRLSYSPCHHVWVSVLNQSPLSVDDVVFLLFSLSSCLSLCLESKPPLSVDDVVFLLFSLSSCLSLCLESKPPLSRWCGFPVLCDRWLQTYLYWCWGLLVGPCEFYVFDSLKVFSGVLSNEFQTDILSLRCIIHHLYMSFLSFGWTRMFLRVRDVWQWPLGWFTKNKIGIFQWETPHFILVIKSYLQNMKKK